VSRVATTDDVLSDSTRFDRRRQRQRRSAVTYVLPYLVSNLDVLVASQVDRHDRPSA
jgi:hypothetical protein